MGFVCGKNEEKDGINEGKDLKNSKLSKTGNKIQEKGSHSEPNLRYSYLGKWPPAYQYLTGGCISH